MGVNAQRSLRRELLLRCVRPQGPECLMTDWWDNVCIPMHEVPLPKPERPPRKPLSRTVVSLRESLPWHSRMPIGRRRAAQRSAGRNVPPADAPVLPTIVLGVLKRRWRLNARDPSPWRMRSLAVLAVALASPQGTTTIALSRLLPAQVLDLHLPARGWYWVSHWLLFRRHLDGAASDHRPWAALSWLRSGGSARQLGWGSMRALYLAGVPGWRLRELVRASWTCETKPVGFDMWSKQLKHKPWIQCLWRMRYG